MKQVVFGDFNDIFDFKKSKSASNTLKDCIFEFRIAMMFSDI